MKILNYNGVKIKYTTFKSVFDEFLNLHMVTLINDKDVSGKLMLTKKELNIL